MINKNKKGIATIFIIMAILFALVIIYLILCIPFIPVFKLIKTKIDYFLILIFFIVIQVLLIYGYYKLGRYAIRGFTILRTKLTNLSINIRNYIIIHD